MDSFSDGLAYGCRFRGLNVVTITRAYLAIDVDASVAGLAVKQVLRRLKEMRGLHTSITMDTGPEFAGNVLGAWAYEECVMLSFIRSGKPLGERVHQWLQWMLPRREHPLGQLFP